MAIARSRLVDTSVTRWYHCITRCVRRALLLNEGTFDRKAWIEKRLELLAEIFAISVSGFSVMDNHHIFRCASISRWPTTGPMKKSPDAGGGSFRRETPCVGRFC